MPFSRPLVFERGERDPLHGGATDKEEVHRTSPLQGRLPASSADWLQTLTRRKTKDLAPRFMHRFSWWFAGMVMTGGVGGRPFCCFPQIPLPIGFPLHWSFLLQP